MSLLVGRIPVDPSTQEARAWLRRELAKPVYADDRSLLQRVIDWVAGLLGGAGAPGGLPGWALPAVLVAVAALLTAVVLVKVRREPASGHLPRGGAVLDEPHLDAAAYRERARRSLDAGAADAATADWFRAIAAGAAERAIIEDSPGRTAHEVSVALAAVFPDEAPELTTAADHFDGIRYGDAEVDATVARFVADLDERLAAAQPFRRPTRVSP